jgi:CheY-like chemotaxis protein
MPSGQSRRKRSALLVDDVVITQRITSAALHRAGYFCDLASNGEQAVTMAKHNDYHVILMDVALPIMNGIEATVKIRESETSQHRQHTIIYGMTASCSDADLNHYNEAGMDGCIEKGCIVSRAMHEALAITRQNPTDFVFINARNVQSIQRRSHMNPDSLPAVFKDLEDEKEQQLQTHGPMSRSVSIGAPVAPNQNPRALLVDDLKIAQKITEVALNRSGYACDMAADGETAVRITAENQYHFILMDVMVRLIFANSVFFSLFFH